MFPSSHGTARGLSIVMAVLFLLALLPSFGVAAAANDNDIWWNQLGHNSRDTLYRYPAGAVPTGTSVTLRMRAADGDLTSVDVRIWNDRLNFEQLVPMTRVASGVQFAGDAELYEFWEATLPASALPTVYWYRFILRDGTRTVYYEDDGARTGGWGQPSDGSPDYSWQLTVYDADFQTPDWVQNAVIYQIFVDRFRDGNPANNPTAGSFFYGNYDTVTRSNSTDWNTAICDPRNALGSNVCNGIYSQNFYGGDLQGVIDKLDYIQALGVTAIYLNPIFESPSNHKYDTFDFMQIDDNFGDLATFQALVNGAHARGIRVILDGVFNHSSSDSVYFDRYSRWNNNGDPTPVGSDDDSGACEALTSPYTDWYTFFNYGGAGTAPCSDNRDYPKWFGIFDSLPVFQHDNTEVRDYFINNGVNSVAPYWMQWADGWRLDVAPEIDHGTINDPSDNYWESFRAAVHAVKPDAYIVGEEWGNPTSWTIGGEWDATMNYQFGAATLSFWRDSAFSDNDFNGGSSAGTLNPLSPSGYNERILNLQERYAPEATYAMMNLFNSHDTNRVLFLLDDNSGSTNNTALYYNQNYDWSGALSRLRGAALVQMTMPGAPTIYYGDEVGTINPPSFDGSVWQDDPYNRVPYPWLDQSGTPFYAHMQNGATQQNLYNYYAQLTAIRNNTPALRTGAYKTLLTDDGAGVYAYGRQMADNSSTAVVVVNKSATARNVTVNVSGYLPAGVNLVESLTGAAVPVDGAGNATVNVPARGGAILVYGAFVRPTQVSDLSAAGGAGQVHLSWSAASGAADYAVYRSRLSHGGFELIGTTASTSYSDTSVSNSVRYHYMVVSRAANGVTSGSSNESSVIPALQIGWANLQWPPTISYTLQLGVGTDTIYGKIWIDGATNQPGATPGLIAQVGYGPDTNRTSSAWTWFPMTFNVQAGNDDEFMGQLFPTAVGTYCYTTRYSTDGGVTWFYAVNGPNEGNPTCPGPFGVLTVNAPADTTAPAAPTNLSVADVTSASIVLAWDAHPNTDGDLAGFQVWRSSGAGFTLLTTVSDAAATGYEDNTVAAGTTYSYYLIAFDSSVNSSDPSNTIEITAENRPVAVTFRVTVPDFTPTDYPVHIVGSFNGWNPGNASHAMTETAPNVREITLTLLDGESIEYKFARGSWDRVEKAVNGYDEVANRYTTADYGSDGTQLVELTVVNWRDPIVVETTPVNGATDQPAHSVITIRWNKWMQTPPNGFTLLDPNGVPVSGSFSFDDTTWMHTFTPDALLGYGVYQASILGAQSGAGEAQTVPAAWSFGIDGAPSLEAVGDQTSYETQQLTLAVVVDDPDGPAPTFSDDGSLAALGLSIDPATGVISGTIPNGIGGQTFPVSISVTDGINLPAVISFNWSVVTVPDYTSPQICYLGTSGNQSQWSITSANLLPREARLRFDWAVYQGETLLAGGMDWSNPASNILTTPLSDRLVITWWIEWNGTQTSFLGTLETSSSNTCQ